MDIILLDKCDISVRLYNWLKAMGITTLNQVFEPEYAKIIKESTAEGCRKELIYTLLDNGFSDSAFKVFLKK